ncbi:MAG: hypothetical protein ACJAXA_002544, partial [Candidatus Aldehydirespiratoraceae bacterium]
RAPLPQLLSVAEEVRVAEGVRHPPLPPLPATKENYTAP